MVKGKHTEYGKRVHSTKTQRDTHRHKETQRDAKGREGTRRNAKGRTNRHEETQKDAQGCKGAKLYWIRDMPTAELTLIRE